jgi:hypothetical protein
MLLLALPFAMPECRALAPVNIPLNTQLRYDHCAFKMDFRSVAAEHESYRET